jgi:hypothetical protein
MHRRSLLLIALTFSLLLPFSAVIAQQPKPRPYDIEEAYHVYSAILPRLDSFNAKLVVIGGLTERAEINPECFEPTARERFKDAIADLGRLNNERRILLRRFDIEKRYEFFIQEKPFVPSAPGEDFWSAFYKRFEGSRGMITLSTVGFNKEKTLAVVYAGSGCHFLCGNWSFYLLEKAEGKWKEVPGVRCVTVS